MGCASSTAAVDGEIIEETCRMRKKDNRTHRGLRDKEVARACNQDFMGTMTFLTQVQLFKRLPLDQHPMLASAFTPSWFRAGQDVIKQGDIGHAFFVIRDGEAAVYVSNGTVPTQLVATLRAGDYFGEHALLRDEPRDATVRALTDLHTFKITREKFTELGLVEQIAFAKRKAIVSRCSTRSKEPSPKTAEDRELIGCALKENKNLNMVLGNLFAQMVLDNRFVQLIDVCWREVVPAGTDVMQEGALIADFFYIVAEGSFEMVKSCNGLDGSSSLVTVSRGGSFGEAALLCLVPQSATVTAKTDAVVWVVDRHNFKNILLQASVNKIKEYVKYLDQVDILSSLLLDEKKAVAEAFVELHFVRDETIFQEGEPGETFYVLYDGEVAISKNHKEKVRLEASTERHMVQFFGQGALLRNEVREVTVTVISEVVKALALDRQSFNLLLGPLDDILPRTPKTPMTPHRPKATLEVRHSHQRSRGRIIRSELTRIGRLGCGGFGSVDLVQHKASHKTYALKSVSKGYVVKMDMQESIVNEKYISMMMNSKFIIRLSETYNSPQTLYFLLEVALGGDLFATYFRKGFHGSSRHARFYTAGVVLAFEHLHQRRVVYRDLKPENLLFDAQGFTKLTDMGLAKFVVGKTFTTCGTPDYFAPELLHCLGHTQALDWWTLGVLIFELMTGNPPFVGKHPMMIYAKIVQGIDKVPFPVTCVGEVGDLIRALLKADPCKRLPMRRGSVQNLKTHPWYHDFDWEKLSNHTLDPPYRPQLKSSTDLSNFSVRSDEAPRYEYVDDGSGWDRDFASA